MIKSTFYKGESNILQYFDSCSFAYHMKEAVHGNRCADTFCIASLCVISKMHRLTYFSQG